MASGSKAVKVGHRYFFGIHMLVSRGEVDELVEIKVGGKRAWRGSVTSNSSIEIDAPELFGGDDGEGGVKGRLDVMMGGPDQPVNGALESMLGGLVPAFRGMFTLFYDGLVSSMNPYPKAWTMRVRRALKGWDGPVWYPEKAVIALADLQSGETIKAMNPAHILYELETNRDWGRAKSSSRLDVASFMAAADKLYAEGFGLCLRWVRTDSIESFAAGVLDHIGGGLYTSRATGLRKLALTRDDYVVEDLPHFDSDSGLLSIEEDDNANGPDAINEIVVTWRNPVDNSKRQARERNLAAIRAAGGRVITGNEEFLGLPTYALAARVAKRNLRAKVAAKRWKLVLDRRARDIEPGDAFRFSSPLRGLHNIVVRAGRIDDGPVGKATITITAVLDVFGMPATTFSEPPPSGWTPPDTTPQVVSTRRLVEVSWRDLVQTLDPANLELVDQTTAYLAALAVRPTGLSLGYQLQTKVGSAEFSTRAGGDFCPTATLASGIPIGEAPVVVLLVAGVAINQVRVGTACLIDAEVFRIDALDLVTSTATLARGCVDTVPAEHASGARVWFFEDGAGVDPTEYSAGVTVQAKLLTSTSSGLLSADIAPVDSLALRGRQGKPYPPGRVRINELTWPSEVLDFVSLTWAHRDHLLQADQLIDTTAGSIGPAVGTTYNAELRRADNNAVIASVGGIAGTEALLESSFEGEVVVQLWSVRDGNESFQRHTHRLYLQQTLLQLIFPLTYDERDSTDTLTLTRSGGAGPHITPEGFEGDGFSARYTATALPSYAAAGRVSLQASIRKPRFRLRSARDVDVFLGTNDAGATPRLSFETVSDSKGDSYVPFGTLALRGQAGAVQVAPLCRVGWRFEWRVPELTRGGYAALPQAALFIDASTVLFLVHLENTEDVVYRVDLASGDVTGFFSFGAPLVAGTHLAGAARRSNGDVWFSGYSSTMLRVDLAASFEVGAAQVLQTVSTEMTSIGAGCFMEVGGTEYHIAASYNDSADASILALFPASVLTTGLSSLALSHATKVFELGRRVQGVVGRSGHLLVARNRPYGGTTSATTIGLIETYNIAGMLSGLASGSAVHAGANASYLLASNVAPSTLPEQMAVHPVSNRLYVPTEGYLAVGDVAGWAGLWSTDFNDAGELNHYSAEYDGTGTVRVKINGKPFTSLAWSLTGAAAVLSIGGLPAAAGGFTSGFSVARIANVALVNKPIDSDLFSAITSGSFETQSLTTYTLSMANPGAEAGSVSGWTAEVGAMGVRSVNPAPYAGAFYFNGGSAVQSISRQRLDLVAQGIPTAQLDSGAAWAKIRWMQAAWDSNDPGGMGVRTLTAADATISTSYSPLAFTPFGPGAAPGGPWFPRCWPVLLAGATRKIDALYNASERTAGTNNDHYVDQVSVTVYHP